MAVKVSRIDSSKKVLGTNIVSSSSTTPSTRSASSTKLLEANQPAVVISTKAVRDSAVASTSTSTASTRSTTAAITAAEVLTDKPVVSTPTVTSKPRIMPVAPTSTVVTTPVTTGTPLISKSQNDKITSILDGAIRDSEEENRKKQLEAEEEAQKQALIYELSKGGSNGESREPETINPEEVDLQAMQDEAAKKAAEQALNGQDAPAEKEPEAPAEDQPVEEPKWYEKLMEHKTAVICVAVAVLAIIVVIIKNRKKG